VALTEEQLNADLVAAMKAREMPRVYVLRGLITAAKNLKVERRGAGLAEADLVQLVRREMRQREEAEDFAVKAGRADMVEQNRAERGILETYVPSLLNEDELAGVIRGIVDTLATPNIGGVMAALRTTHGGRYDGKLASDIAKRILATAS